MTTNNKRKLGKLGIKLGIAAIVAVLVGVIDGSRRWKENYEDSGATEEEIRRFEIAINDFFAAAEKVGLQRLAAGRFIWWDDRRANEDPAFRAERVHKIDDERMKVEEKAEQIGGHQNDSTAEGIFELRTLGYNSRFSHGPFDLTPEFWRQEEAEFIRKHPWVMRSFAKALQDTALDKSALFSGFAVSETAVIIFAILCSFFILVWVLRWLLRFLWRFLLRRVRDIAVAARGE